MGETASITRYAIAVWNAIAPMSLQSQGHATQTEKLKQEMALAP
jgi:hypothetical protein